MRFAELKQSVHDRATAVRLACEWEVKAPKLGNVHLGARFDDCDASDFLRAASQVAPILGSDDVSLTLGNRVLRCVQATRQVTKANVNLGIVLLIAPLAMATEEAAVSDLLNALTPEDGRQVYEAIRVTSPGGMHREGVKVLEDVRVEPSQSIDLIAAMKQAAHCDRIALQYASGFDDFFRNVVPIVRQEIEGPDEIETAIVDAQLKLLSVQVDSLIARKCGARVAGEAMLRARGCLQADSVAARVEFDTWLRADGNQRNPGTTADLIAAALFWLLKT